MFGRIGRRFCLFQHSGGTDGDNRCGEGENRHKATVVKTGRMGFKIRLAGNGRVASIAYPGGFEFVKRDA